MTVLIKIIKLFFLLVVVIQPHYIFSQNYTKSTVVISPQSAVNVNNKYDNRKYNRTINNNNYETNNEYTTNNVVIFNVDTTKKEKNDPLKKYRNNKEYYIDYISNGLARVKRNGRYGFVNEQGTLIIDYKYDNARIYSDSLIPVQLNNNWFVINRNDRLLFYVKDAENINSYNNGFAYVFYKNKIALVNKKGKISDKFDNIEKFDTLNLATVIYNLD